MFNCGSEHSADERYFFVTTNVKLPYWQSAGNRFIEEAKQWKLRFNSPGPRAPKFRKAVQAKTQRNSGRAADAKLLRDDIDKAIAVDLPVLTVDSDAPTSKRLFFIRDQ